MPSEPHQPEPDRPRPPAAPEKPAAGKMTAAELAEAKQYGRRQLFCDVADIAIDLGFLAVMTFVLARPDGPLVQWISGIGSVQTVQLGVLFLVLVGLGMAVSFPLSYYAGHVLEHRFGLARQSLARWLWRYAKARLLGVGIGLPLIVGLYWIIWLTGGWWWLVAAAAFFFVTVLLGQLAPVLILPLFYKIEPLADEDLQMRISRLAAGTGLSIEGTYRIKLSDQTVKANAMLAGLGRTRRVLLGDTLLDQFTGDEIEVILAHEIGHHVFHHIRKMILAGIVYSAAGFWVCDFLLAGCIEGFDGRYSQMPVHALPLVMLILTAFAMLLEPLQNLISRRYERQSDRYALQRTGLHDAYRAAFRKLAKMNKDDPDPHWLDVLLFHSHPPITERLAMAEETPEAGS